MQHHRAFILAFLCTAFLANADAPALSFRTANAPEAKQWQQATRAKLFQLLMGGAKPERVPLRPEVIQRIEMPAGGCVLEEFTLQSLPDRRTHGWMAMPKQPHGKVGAVLAIHGHGGTGEEVVRGLSLYWYGRALAEMGYVVIAPDVGQHDLQHANWTLMGERTWDALRCLDYLETRPEVDPNRLAVAGLSLGGETTMYVAALDERIRTSCSSGWLTTVANMKNGHCTCFNFPGLEENFDFSDIFSCVAPRPLVLELGEKERAPGGFPVNIGRGAFEEIRRAYRVFGAEAKAQLTIHPNGHVFVGRDFWAPLQEQLGTPWPWSDAGQTPGRNPGTEGASPLSAATTVNELDRRGEIARRCFTRALGVLDGWWKTRDAATGLYPRRLDQPVWAPQDNAADMFPFLAITAHFLAPDRLPEILDIIPKERTLTTRHAGLPDWFSLATRTFAHVEPNPARLTFNAAEYCKDGLIPMTEVLGRGPWFDRMVELMDAIFAQAAVKSDFGLLPADDTEVNGDLLQALARLHAVTRNAKYLEWAERIGDAYCLEVLPKNGGLPPHRWDFTTHRAINDTLNLNDHGNELIGGLAELFVAARHFHAEKAALYEKPLREMFHRLFDKARNEDGLWCNLVEASTGKVLNRETPDTWGYALAAMHTFGTATGDTVLLNAVRHALQHIDQPRYLHWSDADAYADAIEGSLLLLNRVPEPAGFAWLNKMLPLFLGKQRDDGIVEGWYGDGNYARTALMAALYFTQGASCHPWRTDLRLSALREGNTLHVALTAEKPWKGRLRFDTPRHRLTLRLPTNYPRLNEFPEWFPVENSKRYELQEAAGHSQVGGEELAEGLRLSLAAGERRTLSVIPINP
ncbi:MAG: acetylxylan esterase [Verrucomicrobiales bacterium]|nr:acetylxylan esterase [Verrucomicrobiales bacterium]